MRLISGAVLPVRIMAGAPDIGGVFGISNDR